MEGGGVGVAVCLHMEDLDHDDDEVLQPLEEEEEDLAAGGKVKQLLSSRASKGRTEEEGKAKNEHEQLDEKPRGGLSSPP